MKEALMASGETAKFGKQFIGVWKPIKSFRSGILVCF